MSDAKPYVMEGVLDGKPFTREFYSKDDYDALAARLAEEQKQHAETLQHNADIGTALTEARARLAEATEQFRKRGEELVVFHTRLAKAKTYIEILESCTNDFVDLKTMNEAIAWRATDSATGRENVTL